MVFDGREDYHDRIDDPSLDIDENTLLFIRGVGPVGYPGGAEVVNMDPPEALLKRGISALPCIGDGRQSGTSGSPSILNAAPEAAIGGGPGPAQHRRPRAHRPRSARGQHHDLRRRSSRSAAPRSARSSPMAAWATCRHSQTPWQEIQRMLVDQFDKGMVLKPAVKYRDVARRELPRDNH